MFRSWGPATPDFGFPRDGGGDRVALSRSQLWSMPSIEAGRRDKYKFLDLRSDPQGTIMTEKPAPKPANEAFVPIRDPPSAPIIFFEFCPTLGNHNGLINIMLAAGIVMPTGGSVTDVVPVAVAHLRCTAAAAVQLRDAIDKALLIGAPVQNPEGKAN